MKSREYRNTINGMIYWLEDGRILMRKPGKMVVAESTMTAEDFFTMVGRDILLLVE